MTLRKPAAFSFAARKSPTGTFCPIVHKALAALGIVLSALLIPILIINLTLMVRARIDPDHIPAVCGYVPMAIMTDSMDPAIMAGDLVIYRTAGPETLREGDIIAFYDPASTQRAVVTHRIAAVTHRTASDAASEPEASAPAGGADVSAESTSAANADSVLISSDYLPSTDPSQLTFITKGDANNIEDSMPVAAENVIGIYRTRIPRLGHLVLFMQTTKGILLCVVLPLLLLIGWDKLRKTLEEHSATLCPNKNQTNESKKEETIIEET